MRISARRRTLVFLAALLTVPIAGSPGAALGGGSITGVGRYIVTLQDGTDATSVADLYRTLGAEIDFIYTDVLDGFAGGFTNVAMSALRDDPLVTRIEKDGTATASATQSSAPWGLDRIDQRSGTDHAYNYVSDGTGVHAYILDTGIKLTHSDFKDRLGNGYDAVTSGGNANDCNGHGTHVAGTVGGTTYGVAKSVILHPVRVLNCTGSGSWSGVIAGIDWTARNASRPAVANMSLGGSASATLDDAVRRAVTAGISFAVAAGNSNADACATSPARVAEAVTVGATDSRDVRASFSNYGTCLDLFAPGVTIVSADYQNDTGSTSMSGTSMASPHVAGAMARYLDDNPGASPSAVASALNSAATTNAVSTAGTGSPNRLLYVAPGTTSTNAAPSANYTFACTDLDCTFTDTSTDSDGTVASRSWTFGDGTSSTLQNPAHTYGAAGTYTVTLRVTDDDGATGSTSKYVKVAQPTEPDPSPPGSGYYDLTVAKKKVKGQNGAVLTWGGSAPAAAGSVDIYRNSAKIGNGVPNTGTYTDNINTRGSASYTYKVCNAGSTTCSNQATVTF
jgi:serine protease